MKSVSPPPNIAKHFALIVGMAALLVLCMVYPFLPGGYDRLAVPLATMAQVFGVVGLALAPGGLLWLARPRFGFALAVWSTALGIEGVAQLMGSSRHAMVAASDPSV